MLRFSILIVVAYHHLSIYQFRCLCEHNDDVPADDYSYSYSNIESYVDVLYYFPTAVKVTIPAAVWKFVAW